MFDRFDLVIMLTLCDDAESLSEICDCLMVDRVDPDLTTSKERREERIWLYDECGINMLISTLWLEVVEMLIDILLHRTTVGDTEELHSFTYTEYGLLSREYFSHRS
jgi:hypothetical protein